MFRARRGPAFLPAFLPGFLPAFVPACLPAFLFALLPALTACSSPQVSFAEVLRTREPFVPDRFPGAAALLSGFDPQDPAAPDSTAETGLFGLELHLGGEVQRWLLLIGSSEGLAAGTIHQQINAPGGSLVYESRRRPFHVTLFDGAGIELGKSTVYAPWDFLVGGFVRSCELAQLLLETKKGEGVVAGKRVTVDVEPQWVDYRGQRLSRPEAARHMYGGFATLTAFLRIIKNDELLSSVLWKVVDRPSVFSFLFHGGVTLSLNAQLTAATPLPDSHLRGGLAGLPGYRTTLRLNANGSPVLDAIMWVTEPVSPYRVSGGILAVEGFRPSDNRVRFRMELLAARR